MSLLFSKEILSTVEKELKSAKKSVQIITAYCKEDSMKKLVLLIDPAIVEKKVMIRCRLDDIVNGSTDLSVLEHCLENGWKTYIRFDLHAKTYIVDNKRGIVGSANATKSGLTGITHNNLEMATLVDIEEQDKEKIKQLFEDAICVDYALIERLKEQAAAINYETIHNGTMHWSQDIVNMFNPKIESLFSYELPDKKIYEIGEFVPFLDYQQTDNIEEFKEKFRWSNAYLWLLHILELKGGEIYLGELSAVLHNAMIEDPKPFRKDIKVLLGNNILALIEELKMDDIQIDRPNYSQRITLKRKEKNKWEKIYEK